MKKKEESKRERKGEIAKAKNKNNDVVYHVCAPSNDIDYDIFIQAS